MDHSTGTHTPTARYTTVPVSSLPARNPWPDIRFVTIPWTEVLCDRASKDNATSPEPVIVPPSWNKGAHNETLSHIWRRAAEHLSEAEAIIFIGYSLPPTDQFFSSLFAVGCMSPTRIKLIRVYNPDKSDDVDARFRALLGRRLQERYEYVPKPFAEVPADLSDIDAYKQLVEE
jgi:hypothetical protein